LHEISFGGCVVQSDAGMEQADAVPLIMRLQDYRPAFPRKPGERALLLGFAAFELARSARDNGPG